jgi:hypothetical protein
MFTPASRYYSLETDTYAADPQHPIAYVCRRFLPPLNGAILAEHEVAGLERLDNITAIYLGDPEQFWRICDANTELRPADLTAEPGRRVKIPSVTGG